DAPAERALDQRRVHLVGQTALGKLREGAGKGSFRRHLRASFPTENATQRLVDIEALDQSGGGRNAQHRLGDESPGEGAAIVRRAAGASGRFGNKGLEADHVEGRDEPPERFGHRVGRTTPLAGQPVPAQAPRRYGAGPSEAGFCAWRNAVTKSASVFSSMSDTAI